MILLALFAFRLLPSAADPFRDHLSGALKLKCDALPYRTLFVADRCYFAVFQEIEFSQASDECSYIFSGAKVSTNVPSSVLDALMVEKSKFHIGRAPSGAKQLICSNDNGYKCEASETMLSNGRCVVRAPKKMNFNDAKKYCANLGMDLPAPSNDLDNRIVRDALVSTPLWVDRSFVGINGFKWRGATYSRWSTCNMTAGHEPRLFSGTQNKLWQCANDVAAVVDGSGYWSNGRKEYLMDVVCLKNAENPFTKGAAFSDYHDANVEELAPLTGAACGKPTATPCYTSAQTTTRYEMLGKATVETQRGCEVLCNYKEECTAFSFKDKGLSSSCVILSTPTKEVFNAPTTIYQKRTSGCSSKSDLLAEFGVDPCIDQMVPSVFRGVDAWRICATENQYFTRAVDICGRRVTFDNDYQNWIGRWGDMWAFVYRYQSFTTEPIPIVAASCVLGGGVKCPCAQPPQLNNLPGRQSHPAVTERWNPCNSGGVIRTDVHRYPGAYNHHSNDTPKLMVTCKAGMWMMRFHEITWGVSSIACYY